MITIILPKYIYVHIHIYALSYMSVHICMYTNRCMYMYICVYIPFYCFSLINEQLNYLINLCPYSAIFVVNNFHFVLNDLGREDM